MVDGGAKVCHSVSIATRAQLSKIKGVMLLLDITDPPNGPVLFCSLASVVVVSNAAGGPAGRPPGGRAADTPRRASRVTSR